MRCVWILRTVCPAELHIPGPLTEEEEEALHQPLKPMSGKGRRRQGPVALGKPAAAGARGAVATGGWAGDADHEQVVVQSSLAGDSCRAVCFRSPQGSLARPWESLASP